MVKPVLGKPAESSSPKYKGVRKRKWGKWVSEIRLPNSRERIWLGSYDSPEKAARAFDAALFCLRGHTAKFNFPDNPLPDIVSAGALTPPEIQVAAARFANSVGPSTSKQPERCSSSTSASSSYSSSSSQLRRESPSPSVSDGAAQLDRTLDGSFLDLFTTVGSENNNNNNNNNSVPDFGIFPGFDDLSFDDPSNEYFFPPPPPSVDYGEDIFDVGFSQDSFLWNF